MKKVKSVIKSKKVDQENQVKKTQPLVKQMAKCIFHPAEHPYQRSMIETLILLLEVGDLSLIFECFKILFRAAQMHRSYDEARYWAGQARIISLAMADPGRVIQVWIWAAEVEKDKADYEKALQCLQRALGYAFKYSHPAQFDVYGHISKCFFYKGRMEEANLFHEKATMCHKEPPEGLLRTSTLKLQNQPLKQKHSLLKADLLNELWLPISTKYHNHFQSPDRQSKPLWTRLKELRHSIREYYDSKGGIVLAQGIFSEPTDTQSLLTLYESHNSPIQPILLSHKTQNKNMDMFMTQESIVPKVNKMLRELQAKFIIVSKNLLP